MKITAKIIWAVVILLCLGALAYIWFVGFPVPEYVATDDGAESESYVLEVAPYTFFSVNMSEREQLTRTDGATFYEFVEGSIITNKSKVDADLIDADKQVYGRPGSFIYRAFDNSSITVRSERSTAQPLKSFLELDTYTVPGYFEDLKRSEQEYPGYDVEEFIEVMPGVFANNGYEYSSKPNEEFAFEWYLNGGSYYTANIEYGTSYDVIQQGLARFKACQGVTFEHYFDGPDFWLFMSDNYLFAVKSINRNTNVVFQTNSTKQMPAILHSLKGEITIG